MRDLAATTSTMSSREIAELTGKDHKHVLTNGEWIPTDKGQPFAVRHQWVKGNKSGYNYKCKKSVLNTLIN